MHQHTLAFASAALSTAGAASASTFHRPFLAPLPTVLCPSYAIRRRQPYRSINVMLKRTPSSRNNRPSPYNNPARNSPSSSSSLSSSSPSSSPSSNKRSLANLHELTERIADLLQVGSLYKTHIHCPKDAPLGYLSAKNHVAVIFGKHLIRDQVTVENAKRIVTFIKQIASGALNPDIICFVGGKGLREQNSVSGASASYAFFRSICEEVNLDVSRFDFVLEEKSHNTKENLRNVLNELRRRNGSDAVSACHFTLVSSDYHLIRIQEVHRLSPRQSILFPLEVSSATWNCIFAAYPFCVSRDAATAFLGRAVVLANDLSILLVNLNGAINDREFLSKENLHRLNETFAKMREMYRVIGACSTGRGGFRTDMRTHAETMEMAIHDVREVQTLLGPLNKGGASISRDDLELAQKLLKATISKMRSSMDPDRVLLMHDRLAIIDDMVHFMASEGQQELLSSTTGSQASISESSSGMDLTYPSEFDESDGRRGTLRVRSDRKTVANNEVTWRGGANFEGNGNRIARDGPNLVIVTENSPPPVAKPSTTKRTRTRRRAGVDSEAVGSGTTLGTTSPTMAKTSRSASSGTTGRGSSAASRSSTSTSSGRASPSAATRKTQQTSTPTKKRKTASPRKLSTPASSSDTA